MHLGIFGTAGMAIETGEIAELLGYEIFFIASNENEQKKFIYKNKVILEKDVIQYKHIDFSIGIGDGNLRKKISEKFSKKLNFVNLIHPDTTISKTQKYKISQKKGIIVLAGVRISTNVKIDDFTIINLNSTVSHDTIIGKFCSIAPQVCILGNVKIGDNVWVGAGAIINQGLNYKKRKIGGNSIIGSGSVVLDDCSSNSTYYGIPARRKT